MKKYALPVIGALLYVIVTMIDILLISLPLSVYVAAITCGAMLIMLYFVSGLLPEKEVRTSKQMVFHIRRQPVMQPLAK